MSFQDFQNGTNPSPSSSPMPSKNPAQVVAAGIFQINTAVAAFRRLVDTIGTSKDTPDHRQKLHKTRQRILHLVKDTSAKLKLLTESDHGPSISANKKVEDAKLARDFQTSLQEFQKVQQLASERESTYAPSLPPSSSLPPTSASAHPSEDPVVQDTQPFLMEVKRQEILLLDNEISFNEAIMEEREQGIRDIEQQIVEANDIFKDLAVLVHDQHVVIDDVRSNIDASSAASAQSKVLLAKASESVKSRTSWCWWVLVVFGLILVIVLLVLIL
ncbi:syntaxin-22-like [Carica papaya]|uniref:syntaxin-22-like n=1 Tax=Carica papaya TaxID=3649 RepID=UPI000B8C95ED|nr:syntaxin-22-like [Carica papaya]